MKESNKIYDASNINLDSLGGMITEAQDHLASGHVEVAKNITKRIGESLRARTQKLQRLREVESHMERMRRR